ncbi:hypothetical protein C9374_010803 [Naegleria lovaniensis]|uniref:non-specific serine/threonine protein kinase n=1 Tax=Naegleria lovaniensis TaxID=51637 RepID=A0AA88GH69_NAELO|nr:uncharacterized protein C9374_010803 [Naegleria lovaniensis]KAG2374519.1 hypothetical protein C9374_010803 [Naegleria lovaniensis]
MAPDSNGNEFAGYNGDGLKATESLISTPTSLFLTAQGEIYFIEQTIRIRKISVDGILSTVAGRFQYDGSSKAPQSAASTYLNTINSISFVKNKDSKSGGDIWIHSVDSFYNSYLLSKVDIKNGYLSRLSGFRIDVNGMNAIEGLLKNVLVTGLVSTCGFSNGDVIIAARQYHVLYKYVAATGLVSIIAGTFRKSSSPPTEGLASQSLLVYPRVPMCFDNGDILFIQGVFGLTRISKYVAATESIVFLANVTATVNGAAISPFTGDLYFVEQTTSTVKMKNFTSGEISIIAGNEYSGYSGEDVLATEASLRNPQSLVFLKNGDLVISDSGNGLIRKVSKETKRIVTIGGMIPGSETCNYNGDGRLSTQTCAGLPTTIVSGDNGELYYADQTFGLVRKMIPFCEGNRTLDNETFLECICLNGWSGSNCEIPSCNGTWANDIRVCSGNGQCKSLDSCQCQNGFEGPLCERTSLRQNTDAIIIGVVVGVGGCLILSALVIVVIVIASYLSLRRGKNSKNSEVNIENGKKGISHISTLNSVELETNFSSSDFPSDASVSFTPLMTENGSGTVSAEARGQAIDPFSRYQNIVKIGQGAFGSVFKANDTKYGNKAKAVKVMKFSSMSELNSIMKEGIQLMNIRHDNILKVNDIFLSKDQLLCLDMDYYEKGDLNKFTTLAPGHAVECNEKIVKQVIYQICTALVYVHGTLNIIHRDIKPSNIFIQSFDEKKQQIRVVLADFGLAKGNQGSEAQSYAGTPLYMSPEIGLGSKYYANTDVYSLGVTVYQMMTKDTATSISHLLLTKEPSVSKQILKNKILENDYSEELANIVLQMLEKESVTRPNAQDILSLPYFNK